MTAFERRLPWICALEAYINQLYALNKKMIGITFYHQDQVVKLPDNATLIATKIFCPVQIFVIDNLVWVMQAHPEMLRVHNHLLIKEQKKVLSHGFKYGVDSLRMLDHGRVVSHWIVNFFEGANYDCW